MLYMQMIICMKAEPAEHDSAYQVIPLQHHSDMHDGLMVYVEVWFEV